MLVCYGLCVCIHVMCVRACVCLAWENKWPEIFPGSAHRLYMQKKTQFLSSHPRLTYRQHSASYRLPLCASFIVDLFRKRTSFMSRISVTSCVSNKVSLKHATPFKLPRPPHSTPNAPSVIASRGSYFQTQSLAVGLFNGRAKNDNEVILMGGMQEREGVCVSEGGGGGCIASKAKGHVNYASLKIKLPLISSLP